MVTTALLRDATEADFEALCRLRNTPRAQRTRLKEAGRGTLRLLVAEEETQLVGFASLYLSQPEAGRRKSHIPKLSDCYVALSHRRAGIGSALVERRERIARKMGCHELHVSVDPVENPGWFTFFVERGYRPVQVEPYQTLEPGHTEDGSKTQVLAWRLDLRLELE